MPCRNKGGLLFYKIFRLKVSKYGYFALLWLCKETLISPMEGPSFDPKGACSLKKCTVRSKTYYNTIFILIQKSCLWFEQFWKRIIRWCYISNIKGLCLTISDFFIKQLTNNIRLFHKTTYEPLGGVMAPRHNLNTFATIL